MGQWGGGEQWDINIPETPFKPVLVGVDNVAPFITVNEQSESNPDCSFHSSIAFSLPGDRITRI